MTVLTDGNDRRVSAAKRYLEKEAEGHAGGLAGGMPETLFLLPVPSFAPSADTDTVDTVERLAEMAPLAGACVAGYAIPDVRRAELLAHGAFTVDVANDETFLTENARLTAVGALAYLFSGETRAPGDLTVGIVGYGRIGRELLRLCAVYGCAVRVFTANEESRLALGSYGVAVGDSRAPDFKGLDVLINTAPAPVITKEGLPIPPPRVLELASGGHIGEGVCVERLPGVPARFYPESAGESYARAVLRGIREALVC